MPHPKKEEDQPSEQGVLIDNPTFDMKTIEQKTEKTQIIYPIRDPSVVDTLPYYQPLALLIFIHIVYIYTGSMILAGWLVYIGTPLYNFIMLDDERNVDRKVEKTYLKD